MTNTKNKKLSVALTDVILIAAMIVCFLSTKIEESHGERGHGREFTNEFSWGTLHSISSIILTLIVIIHIIQHWSMIKGIIVKRLFSKNIVVSFTAVAFIITVVSFLVYLTGFTHSKGEFHGTIANIFLLTALLHLVLNFKKMLLLFKNFLHI
jgi:hypothetical protein